MLHLAKPDDLERLLPLVEAFHAESGFDSTEEHRATAVSPLLNGSPYGAIWIIGPRKSPVGYIAVTMGWSLEFGGLDAIVDEFYVRPAVRGRGMGGEALRSLAKALAGGDVRALHLEADKSRMDLVRFYKRCGFLPRDRYMFMSQVL
ncbi:MAG: GNAT family N-acetyltransferase [Paracoccaceae bacterium]